MEHREAQPPRTSAVHLIAILPVALAACVLALAEITRRARCMEICRSAPPAAPHASGIRMAGSDRRDGRTAGEWKAVDGC